MNKKLLAVLGFILLFSLSGPLHAQILYTIDNAILEGAKEIEASLQPGVKVVVLNFASESSNFSNYVIDELMTALVKNRKLVVVDRTNLELIQKEMNFQMSGEVSDSSAQAIGQKLGAQSIISGSISDLGTVYRVRFRVIEVVSAMIQATPSLNVQKNDMVAFLMGKTTSGGGGNTNKAPATPKTQASGDFGSLKNSSVWLGARLGGSVNGYVLSDDFSGLFDDIDSSFTFNLAAHFGWQIVDAFALQFEFMYNRDKPTMYALGLDIGSGLFDLYETFTYSTLSIPLLAKITFWPGNCSIGLFGGLCFNINLGKINDEMEIYLPDYDSSDVSEGIWNGSGITSPPIGLVFGLDFGVKAGPGMIFADARIAIDLGSTYDDDDLNLFNRVKIPFTFGYSIGLGQRK